MTEKEFDFEIRKMLSRIIPESPIGQIFRDIVFVTKTTDTIDWWHVAELIVRYMPEKKSHIETLKGRVKNSI